MKLGIIGTGAMGKVLASCALEDGTFETIHMIEPTEQDCWPKERMDLLIDFSHPDALKGIYDYCRGQGGNIPVILASTGYGPREETLVDLLEKICPVVRKSNFSRGVAVMTELCQSAKELCGQLDGGSCDIRLTEVHHTKKIDAPSGTARSLCSKLGLDAEDKDRVQSLRMGTVYGEHTVYFALEDEIIEIKHTALSKKIFAIGALEEGKKLLRH
jgi:4-hydroxy-tetrahydrodipicolinate reductase